MRPIFAILLVISILLYRFSDSFAAKSYCIESVEYGLNSSGLNEFPVAINDTFELLVGCENNSISGNIMENDYDPDGDAFSLSFVQSPGFGTFKINSRGEFNYTVPDNFTGILVFKYRISEKSNSDNFSDAEFVIFVRHDHDCDGVADGSDLDNDNDGILDINEGNGDVDFDKDGIPNNLDIDSDNDGITDNQEWQKEGNYITPKFIDENKNGWDDAYDVDKNGVYYQQNDADGDGTPDFLDFDSDDDKIPDSIEGFDNDNDGVPELKIVNSDVDGDGLDDAYDSVSGWLDKNNSLGSYAYLRDFNNNGIRDWRESANDKPIDGNGNYLTQEIEKTFSAIYPNPNKGSFKFLVSEELVNEGAKIMVTNINGKILFNSTITSTSNTIAIPNIEAGTYLIKVFSATKSNTKKLIVTK